MKRQTILITGASGLIGSGFINDLAKNKFAKPMKQVLSSRIGGLIIPSHEQMDITNYLSIKKFVDKYKPDVIVNFAAHRDANTAEEQRGDKKGSAWMTNVIGVENVVKICKLYKIRLIHISTDYVFGGYEDKKGPYSEKDLPESDKKRLSWYGWTKNLAEKIVLAGCQDSCVVRIGNVVRPVYDPKLDYVGKVLWLYDQNKLYPIFNDQFITLSYIPEIALVIEKLLEKKISGIFHAASQDLATPFDIAEYLLLKSRSKKDVVKKSSIDQFFKKNLNRYPKYGGLKTKETQKKLGIRFSTWREIVDNFIKYAKK